MSWRIYAALGAILAVLGAFLYLRHLQAEVVRQKAIAQASQRQAHNAETASKAVDHYVTETRIIREKSQHAVEAVRALPGAETPIAPGRRSVLCDQLASVWNAPICTEDDRPGDLPGGLQGPDKPHADPGR